MPITGMHAILYSKEADATRAFFKNVLGLPSVDAGRGWLIFAAPPSEVAVHPAEGEEFHELYLMCDDIEATLEEMRAKGIVTRPIQDQPWGRLSRLVLPSGEELGIYQPKHPTALGLQRP
jgi:predicted enzyme related to lactoylglutathione lyase